MFTTFFVLCSDKQLFATKFFFVVLSLFANDSSHKDLHTAQPFKMRVFKAFSY